MRILNRITSIRMVILLLTLCSATISTSFALKPLNFGNGNIHSNATIESRVTPFANPVRGAASLLGRVNVAALPESIEPKAQMTYSWHHSTSHVLSAVSSSSTVIGPRTAARLFTTSRSNVSIASSFDGLNQIQSCKCVPPDVIVAAGPNHIVELVNLEGQVFTKQGASLQLFDLSTFFNTGVDTLSDPKIMFDSQSGRWFASIIDIVGYNPQTGTFTSANIRVAVSMTDDPTSFWNVYNIGVGKLIPDQPIVGLNDDKLVITANDFANPLLYLGAEYWVLNKAEMVSGLTNIHMNTFGYFAGLESVHPVQSLSSSSTEYMVSSGGGDVNLPKNVIQFFSVTGLPTASSNAVVSSPFNLTISTIGSGPSGGSTGCGPDFICFPQGPLPGGGQPGNISGVNTDDFRVEDASWSNGKLWLGLNDACTPAGDTATHACFRLVQIDTTTNPVLVKQDFDVGTKGYDYFYPALRTDNSGDLSVIFGFSSNSTSTCCFPSLAVIGQGIGGPANSTTPVRVLKSGSAPDTSTRYGDYFGAAVDPSDPTLVWVAGEYHNNATGPCYFNNGGPTGNCWSTFIASIRTMVFTLASTPEYLTIGAGSSTQSTINIASKQGFAGSVSLSATISPVVSKGPIASLSPNSVTLAANQTVSTRLTVSTNKSTPTRFYNVSVIGTSGTRSYSIIIPLRVGPDFNMTANPATLSFLVGVNANSTITLTSLNQLSGTISLTASIAPAGPTATLNSTSVSLTQGGRAVVNLAVRTPFSTAAGTYIVTVTGTSGSVSHSVKVTVNLSGFGITATPTRLSLVAGTSGNSSIVVRSINNFVGTVYLSGSSTPTGPGLSFVPGSVALASGKTAFATLVISTNNASLGTYNITVNGVSWTQLHSAIIALNVTGDFSLSRGLPSIGVLKDKTGGETVSLTSILGFSGTVSLNAGVVSGAVSGSIPLSLNPNNITLIPNGTGYSTLSITGSTWGNFNISVTGTSGSLSHTVFVGVIVGGLICAASPSQVPPAPSNQCPPSSNNTINGPLTFPPTQVRVGVYINNSDSIAGYEIILKANHTVLKPVGADFTGSVISGGAIACIGGVGNQCISQDNSDTLHVFALSASDTVPGITGLLFTAIYNITASSSGITVVFQTGCSNTSIPDGTCITAIDSSGSFKTEIAQSATFATGSFTMSANPSNVRITCGTSGCSPGSRVNATLTVTSIAGFSGWVNLTYVSPNPNCCTILTGPTSVYIPLAGSANATITIRVSGTTSSNYIWTILGSGGGSSANTTVTITYTWCGHCV